MKFTHSILVLVAAVALSGCAHTSQECTKRVVVGSAIGAVAGAGVGAAVGSASGGPTAGEAALVGAGGGAILGGVVAGLTCTVPSQSEPPQQVVVRQTEK